MTDLTEKAKRIKLVAMDVDGVLTTGEITYTSAGDEIKSFNVKDGQGIADAVRSGLILAIITARTSPMVERRAVELKIHHLCQWARPKLPALETILTERGLTMDEVAYIGDDTPDLPVLERVGLACCPADAVEPIKQVCHYIAAKEGGRGAVREILDFIRTTQG